MPMIQLLSEETINQIAAGEVIENPACVVKELIENSLDAGADKIVVTIQDGGLELIRVVDNGCGMDAEDARLCLQRHATSKMRHFTDLFQLTTMGFRGEALAAVGSVSKLTLTTAISGAGISIEMEGGVIKSEQAIGRARGTTVEIRELFYNVPARKKFQKSATALSAEVFRVVTGLALSAPSVHFELISGGRKALTALPCQSALERAQLMMGLEFSKESIPLLFEEGEFKLQGLLGSPQNSRPNRLGQYLFLNGRVVQCAALGYAIREGYGTRLDEKRHPIYLLHLNIPTDLVDVNVHPQKREVRLRDERVLKQRVQEAVEKAFHIPAPRAEFFDFKPVDFSFAPLPLSLREESVAESVLPLQQPEEKILGLIGPYLLVEGSNGLLVVDLRLARFRLLFDQLMQAEEGCEKQGLLLPITFHCTPLEAAMLLTHLEAIEALGFAIRPVGKDLFLVDAVPSFLDTSDLKPLLIELSALLQEFIGKAEIQQQRRRKLALTTARFAKNLKSYNVGEARELMRALRASSDPVNSPDGHPIMVHLGLDELQRLFSN